MDLRIAIVHEWFTTFAGSEKVVEQILAIYPHADIFVLCADMETVKNVSYLQGRNLKTSFIQKLPKSAKYYRSYLPLMPLAIEQFDLSNYNLIISSSHAVAKGILTGPNQLHISYVHSPIRYAWDLQHQYLQESGLKHSFKGWIAKWFLHKIRIWDYRTAAGVDFFIANSHFVERRINKIYRRSSHVIYPPVNVSSFEFSSEKKDYYLAASRLVPYKRIDLIAEAFSKMPDKELVVIGDGPDMKKLQSLSAPNIKILGHQPFEILKQYMQQAKAFVFAAEEDFGIIPVEAQACGTPVIAYGNGGGLETVVDSQDPTTATGIWFFEQSAQSIIQAIQHFESSPTPIKPEVCRTNAERFSIERFKREFTLYINKCWDEFQEASNNHD